MSKTSSLVQFFVVVIFFIPIVSFINTIYEFGYKNQLDMEQKFQNAIYKVIIAKKSLQLNADIIVKLNEVSNSNYTEIEKKVSENIEKKQKQNKLIINGLC